MENGTGVKKVKIECVNISKYFGEGKDRIHVLDNISISVYENEFIVVLGPGQSGKTTLLKIIAGLYKPSSGKVYLEGKEVEGPGPDRGIVFQRYTLFPWKTVLGNVEIGLKLRGVPKEERRKIASYYINLVGLSGFENHYPHQLSGGMKQRVGIARAYAINPKVMLLDEPFGQLDAQTRYLMEQETQRIWQQEKRTVIFVTNNIEEAVYLGDRIVVLDGKLPGRMKKVYKIDLPRPRDYTDPAFLELRHSITEDTQLLL
ncbi:ABC transporter ATP-binding protein [Neomoorella humiferrea]|uniref:Bicarbonate transport ATP-binding protein CmpD n=1 Tax=Neomoorella humiferrea TaxID=676965 RepID=A0A2T0AYS2_9FIRM|nr:ABC transporter ATP-binding protein [Moorella humiferrea]PRR76159.1 Bicarbonate transport ATP-binding protein CmpD [Moorella humiferrea]